MGDLIGLRSLNLSNNMLTGKIPPSLGNLSGLESLDLSRNKLSGPIPQRLVRLTFLQSFDVSRNNLSGPIPRGNQFDTFKDTCYVGNQGLCGRPLSTECGNLLPKQPSVSDDDGDDSGSAIELDWKFILAGSVVGVVVGLSIGDMVIVEMRGWFVKIVSRRPRRKN